MNTTEYTPQQLETWRMEMDLLAIKKDRLAALTLGSFHHLNKDKIPPPRLPESSHYVEGGSIKKKHLKLH